MKADLVFPRELPDEIADKIVEKLIPLINNKNEQGDVIFDVQDLAEYLKVTPKWIYERTHLKEIPFLKLSGKQLRFRKQDIDKWLEIRKTPALYEFSGKLKKVG